MWISTSKQLEYLTKLSMDLTIKSQTRVSQTWKTRYQNIIKKFLNLIKRPKMKNALVVAKLEIKLSS